MSMRREPESMGYKASANLGEEWKVFCPAKEVLLQMLKRCHDGGIGYAVLDPDLEKAKRLFNVRDILSAIGD
jgi:hypothetical protein